MLKKVKVTNVNTGAVCLQLIDTDSHEKALIGCGLAPNETAEIEDVTGLDEKIQRLSSPGASTDDRAAFFSGLGRCLDRNIGIVKSLQLQTNRVKSAKYKGLIAELVTALAMGEKLSEAMAKHPVDFPDEILSLVIAGEEAGQLGRVCRRIGISAKKSNKIVKKLKAGLIYPAVVIVLSVVVVIIMSFTLVPSMAKLFKSFNSELPMGTKALMWLSDLFMHKPYMAMLPFVGFYFFFSNWGKISGTRFVQNLSIKLPVIGVIVRKSASALGFRTLAMLVDSNVRLSSALEITARATWHYHYKLFFSNLRDHIAVGRTMHEGFLMESHLLGPDGRNLCGLIELASETGTGTEMLTEIADDYEEELDTIANSMDKLIEPITMMILGVMVGFLIYAIYGPIFSLGDTILPGKGKKH